MLWALLLSGCSSLPENNQRQSSYHPDISLTSNTRLGRDVAQHQQQIFHAEGKSGFYLLVSGYDAFVARAVLARQADKTLDLQYYLYQNDLSSRVLTGELLAAADRGVRVRLLVDDMGLNRRDEAIAMVDAHPNIEIRVWNPFSRTSN